MLSSHIIKATDLSDNESNINIDIHFSNGTTLWVQLMNVYANKDCEM